jgi:hypothetical protein
MKEQPTTTAQRLLFTLFMAIGLSIIVSAAMTLVNVGLGPRFLPAWASGVAIGTAVAFPASLLVEPIGRRLAQRLLPGTAVHRAQRKSLS